MKKNLLLTIVFSLLLNGVLYSQIELQNGSFEEPADGVKYTGDGSGGGGPSKMDDNLTGWWADAFATDCGRESPRTEGQIPDGTYVGFAFNNDEGSIWNLAGTVEEGLRDLYLTCYVQESWPQNIEGMSVVIKFATYDGDDPNEFAVIDILQEDWDKSDADENGFVFYEFFEILPTSTVGQNLLIGFDIETESAENTWVNFDLFELEVNTVTGVANTVMSNHSKIYPNPARDLIKIETNVEELSEYRLVNISGKEMISGTVNNNESLNVSSLDKGIYFLNIQNSLGVEVIKTVIK